MHHFFLARLVGLLAHYGYVVLFPIAVIEGPVASMIAGAFSASGEFDFLVVFFILVVADLLGDMLYYSLGRFSHKHFLQGIGTRLGITEERMEPLRKGFRKHDWKIILFGKTQALGSIVLYFAGVTRMPFSRFLLWNLIGTLPKTLIFELIGYFLGLSIINSTKYLNELGAVTFVVAILLGCGYWFTKRYIQVELEKD